LPTPAKLDGLTLLMSEVREKTGCSVVGVRNDEGLQVNPPADTRLEAGREMILVGSSEASRRFMERFVES